jgi:hypothetical protein
MTVVYIEFSLNTSDMQFSAFATLHHHILTIDVLINHIEVQGCDTSRDGHADIIRVDLRQGIYLRNVLHLVRAP